MSVNVTSTITVSSDFDGGGKTYINQMGDKPLFSIGNGARLRNVVIDDNAKQGTGGAVLNTGTGSIGEYIKLRNSVRYGLIFGYGARDCVYRYNTIEKCQHGISGSAYPTGQWTDKRQVNCQIYGNVISGMSVDGIKLKQLESCEIYGNTITVEDWKSGIYFAGSDSPNKYNHIYENNITSRTGRGSGILIHQDTTTNQVTVSEGNIIERNSIAGFTDGSSKSAGIMLTGSNYVIRDNDFINCTNKVLVKPLVYTPGVVFPPPSGNEGNDVPGWTDDEPETWSVAETYKDVKIEVSNLGSIRFGYGAKVYTAASIEDARKLIDGLKTPPPLPTGWNPIPVAIGGFLLWIIAEGTKDG